MPSCLFVCKASSKDAEIGIWQTQWRLRTGCQGVIEHPLPSSFFFFLPLSPNTDSALISGEVSFLFVRCTGQTHHPGR